VIKKSFIILALSLISLPACAFDINSIEPANPLNEKPVMLKKEAVIPVFDIKRATLTKNSLKNQYTIAMNKFMQSNIRSSYSDFKVLIDSITPNDYLYMYLAHEMASIGFFGLSELSMSKISDNDIASLQEKDVKNFYFPTSVLNYKDQMYLAEVYSNIMYNDQSREATAELLKHTSLLTDNDYANYLAALGSMKSGNIEQALSYINKAAELNPKNINYKMLRAEIISQTSKPKNALSIVNEIISNKTDTVIFDKDIHSTKEYVLYKTSKNEYEKKYHLAYYYYDKGELNKALGVLQTAISGKKNINKDVFALTARVYFDLKEFEKASDYAQKSLDIDKSSFRALIVEGDLSFRNKDYNSALKYYKSAVQKDKDYMAAIKLAKTYQILGDISKAKEIYSKILKVSSKTYEAYYQMALLEKDREIAYIKKALSINPDFTDGWIDMARISMSKNNFDDANSFLNIAKYIDDNNYRYYYYEGLILKNKGLVAEANKNFQKSLELNPDYDLPKEELNI